jgi:uncharacterized membrane protein
MTLKRFQQIKLVFVVIVAVVFSQSIIQRNYILPIVVLIISLLVLMYLRRQVKEIIADERDYEIAGKSASYAIQIYSWGAVIGMFVLYAFRDINPSYEPIATTLAFSTCILMILYSFLFRYYRTISMGNKKNMVHHFCCCNTVHAHTWWRAYSFGRG